jgi:hypothetical protein
MDPQIVLSHLSANGSSDQNSTTADEHEKEAPQKEGSHPEGSNGTQHLGPEGAFWEPAAGVIQDDGVTKIEALYLVFGKGWGLFALWA